MHVVREERDEGRSQFPFEGLHVYQRTQEAWTAALELAGADPLWEALEEEIRRAALGIARATARSRTNGGFAAELEDARGALHAAAAVVDQLIRRGTPVDSGLRSQLADSGRMLAALIRSLAPGREEQAESEALV
ncbi:MAG: hypothetical protein ABR527_00640 [Gemmatimonadota bacterium]